MNEGAENGQNSVAQSSDVSEKMATLNIIEGGGQANTTDNAAVVPMEGTPPQPPPVGEDDGDEEVDLGDEAAPPGERCVLEDYTRCSESHLWKLMMSFYDRKGVESWSQGIVPHFITCNAFIGKAYAQVLYGFIRDCMSGRSPLALDPAEPLYVIELGAGSGKFSFFMLKALLEMKEVLEFPAEKIVYVMTDFTENNFNFWNAHPMLKPYIESGQLDSAIFDAVGDTSIRLSHSGTVLAPGTVKNPICIVANYLFDTLCHDIFQVENGKLKEGLISVGSRRRSEDDPLDPEIIKRFDNRFKYEEVGTDYYKDEDGDEVAYQRILQWYVDYFGGADATPTAEGEGAAAAAKGGGGGGGGEEGGGGGGGASILLPVGALRALRRLTAFSGGRALVVSGDKGNNNPEQFRGLMDPHIAVHGSFSVMVNYHAIGTYFTSRGGFALHNPQEEASLKVSTFVVAGDASLDDPPGGEGGAAGAGAGAGGGGGGGWAAGDVGAVEALDAARSARFPLLRHSFHRAVEAFGPNDFFVMQKCLKEDSQNPSLKSVVALLKLGDWDPDVFYKFRDVILNQVPTAGLKLRKDLCRGMPRVWENYYMLDKDKDVAFEIGRFYYGIRHYADALRFYTDSSDTIGEHHVTYHNMGLCYYSLGQMETALTYFDKSLGMNAEYEKAQSWKKKVQNELKGTTNEEMSDPTMKPENIDDSTENVDMDDNTGDVAAVPSYQVVNQEEGTTTQI